MGHHKFAGLEIGINELALRYLDEAAEGGGGGVFHGSAHVVTYGYLGVFLPGIFHAQFFRKEVQHLKDLVQHYSDDKLSALEINRLLMKKLYVLTEYHVK